MKLNQLTILQAHEGLRKKQFSSLELTRACFNTIREQNKKINAFITIMEQQALDTARSVDKKIASSGVLNILEGIPLGIKDNILVDEVTCTAGSKMLENYVAVEDATVITKLKNAGAILIGKTNLDEFAMGSSTENSGFGPVKNPMNTDYVPGGSSGGSAAAVLAHMCLGALGSDTGGSIRQPASFCGVVGLKPTYGRVSRYGLIAMASSLDQIGAIAQSVDDASVLLRAIEGNDTRDATSVDPLFPIDVPVKQTGLKNITIGVPKEYFMGEGSIKKNIEHVIKKLEQNGAEIVEVSLPHTKDALAVYYIIMPSEVSANLSRYGGVTYGLHSHGQSLLDIYGNSRSKGFGNEVKRRIMLGTYALSEGYYDAYYLQAQKVRALVSKDFSDVFSGEKGKKVDCLLTPTSPTPAFKIGEKINDPLTMYLSDIYTVPVNLAGLPAISIPVGESNGLPVGAQLIGNYFNEHMILGVAKVIEEMEIGNGN